MRNFPALPIELYVASNTTGLEPVHGRLNRSNSFIATVKLKELSNYFS